MTQYTDLQLKLALSEMLPTHIAVLDGHTLIWIKEDYLNINDTIRDTELLHICYLIEETLTDYQFVNEWNELLSIVCGNGKTAKHASWQQRTVTLANIKNVEIL